MGGFEAKLPFIVYPRVIDKEKDDSMLDLFVLTLMIERRLY